MLTINTNLSSLIVQSNLNQSTNALNRAIERMTTGFKINHAKDNAANYSISTKLSSQLSSYEVAQENASMGLDMLTTATDSLDLISSHLSRCRDLAEQAANGTYGEDSIKAIQAEIAARMAEIERITANTEYNGINLFEGMEESCFIGKIEAISEEEAIAQGYTVIKTAEELQAMKDNLSGKYILMNDIDLSTIPEWECIGNPLEVFVGEFNGNGHKISNMTIANNKYGAYCGLFGNVGSGGKISNVGVENVNISANSYVAGVAGYVDGGEITNCYVTGTIKGAGNVAGIAGMVQNVDKISNCWSDVSITSLSGYGTGGIVGSADNTLLSNCFSLGDVSGGTYTGGLAGLCKGAENCYATGNVNATSSYVGGLVGSSRGDITNCYATGSVTGTNSSSACIGGLVGRVDSSVKNCFSTGDVISSMSNTGGIAGECYTTIANCYVLGNVQSTGRHVGAIAGNDGFVGSVSIVNSYWDKDRNEQTLDKPDGTSDGAVSLSEINTKISAGTLISKSSVTGSNVHLSGISADSGITLQVGIHSGASSEISVDTSFSMNLALQVTNSETARNALEQIDDYLRQINEKQTQIGSAYNRLESALESIGVSIDNLTSTQSTIRDADVAEESSAYIRNQILQQASATLLATANQTPAIALQLL